MSIPMPDVSGTDPVADATTGPEVTPDNSGGDNPGGESGGNNPAWSTLLDKVPSGLHPMLTPVLREWDTGVQNKIQEVQSQYKPYAPILEGTTPEQLQAAVELYRLADSNPQALYEQMGSYFGFGSGQGPQQETEQSSPEGEFDLSELGDLAEHPKFQELMQNQQAMASVIMAEQQRRESEALSQQLDSEMTQITQANPEFQSEQHQVMIYRIAAASNCTLTEAAEQLKQYNSGVAQASHVPAPTVLGGSGGQIPATPPTDPTKMDGKSTRQLVADLLTQTTREG